MRGEILDEILFWLTIIVIMVLAVLIVAALLSILPSNNAGNETLITPVYIPYPYYIYIPIN